MRDKIENLINSSAWRVNSNNLFNVDGASTLKSNMDYLSNVSDWRVEQICNLASQNGIDLYGQDQLLDAGCGFGVSAIVANLKGVNWVGIEPDPAAIALTREVASFCGLSESRANDFILQGDGESLIFADDTFSAIVSHQVIEHVGSPKNYLRELIRVLKPNGILLLTAPESRMCYEPHYGIPWIPFLNKEHCVPWLEIFEKNFGGLNDFNYVSGIEIRALALSIGFADVELSYCNPNTSESLFDKDLARMMRDSNKYTVDHDEIKKIATRVKLSQELFTGDSFQIIARKSLTKKKKSFFKFL